MSKALIRLKQKPAKPKRGTITRKVTVDGETVAQIMEGFDCKDTRQVIIKLDDGWDSSRASAVYTRPQTDKEFEEVMSKYRKQKDAYDTWYAENEELINAEAARRKKVLTDRLDRDTARRHRQLKSELTKLEKKLESSRAGLRSLK